MDHSRERPTGGNRMDRTDTVRFAEKECLYEDHQVTFYARYGDKHDCTVIRTVQDFDGRTKGTAQADHIRWEDRKTAHYEEILLDSWPVYQRDPFSPGG